MQNKIFKIELEEEMNSIFLKRMKICLKKISNLFWVEALLMAKAAVHKNLWQSRVHQKLYLKN
jgi:hypothetical protein